MTQTVKRRALFYGLQCPPTLFIDRDKAIEIPRHIWDSHVGEENITIVSPTLLSFLHPLKPSSRDCLGNVYHFCVL